MDTTCTYHGNRDEMLVAYLYNDIEAAEREACERHIALCASCRRELGELGGVREQLARWSPPEPAFGIGRTASPETGPSGASRTIAGPARWWSRLSDMPAWAQVAAAALVLGVSAGAANLQITYDETGLSVRTGWMSPAFAATAATPGQVRSASTDASAFAPGTTRASAGPASAAIAATAGQAQSSVSPAPWSADLAALEEQLRGEMRASAAQPATRAASTSDTNAPDTIRRVRTLIEESEKRQQRELALRFAEIANDVRTQRVADLRIIDRMQSSTGVDMMRLYRMTNDLAVRVAQVR